MPVSETARHDLYNGLAELLGPDRAETLMTYLPTFDPVDVATKADIDRLRVELRAEMAEFRAEMRAELRAEMGQLGKRIDRVLFTLVAGLFVIVAAMTGVVVATL